MRADVRGMTERLGSMERQQGSEAAGVAQATSALRTELSQARAHLAALQAQAHARVDMDRQVADSVRRLETIIAGTQSKGMAGENILDAVFAKLPPEWQERNFRVGNRVVEFALRLPDRRVLPIDSKWPATDLIEQFAASEDPVYQGRLKRQIEAEVLHKAREVTKYLDPDLTVSFGIAAVPDAVYDLCSDVQSRCFDLNVVLVAYSMFIPYLLLVFQMALKSSQSIDMNKLDAHLRAVDDGIHAVQEELEGRFSRALTMLANSRDDMRRDISRAGSSLAGLQVWADEPTSIGDRDRTPLEQR